MGKYDTNNVQIPTNKKKSTSQTFERGNCAKFDFFFHLLNCVHHTHTHSLWTYATLEFLAFSVSPLRSHFVCENQLKLSMNILRHCCAIQLFFSLSCHFLLSAEIFFFSSLLFNCWQTIKLKHIKCKLQTLLLGICVTLLHNCLTLKW